MAENEDFKVEGQWVLGRDDPACAIVARKINSIATSYSDVMARERRVAILQGLSHCRNPKTGDPSLIKARLVGYPEKQIKSGSEIQQKLETLGRVFNG